ncbi:MAG: restriction endonuclease [Desulfobacterales bacterium]|nr:restriction endonuclease [Desulfobacterales bacterium]
MTDFRTRKKFSLSTYFEGAQDLTVLNIINTMMRFKFQRADGKDMEFDVLAESDCGRVILVEVKKTKEKIGVTAVKDFIEKVTAYKNIFSGKKALPCFLSVGGFTDEALKFCNSQGIGTAEHINYYQQE